MTLTYQLTVKDKAEQELADDFCKFIIGCMKKSIKAKLESMPVEKVSQYENVLLNSEIINWEIKPSKIDIYNVFSILIRNLSYDRQKDFKYSIHFKNVVFPNSFNTIDTIVRLLDKGNERFIGIHIFNDVFSDYVQNTQKYWKVYILRHLNRLTISKVVIIK